MATNKKVVKNTKKSVNSRKKTGSGTKSSGKFQPGKSGNPAGRKPGSKNKRTLALGELCAEKNFNPIEFLIDVAKDEKNEMGCRIKAACEVNACLNPKLKAIEHSGNLGGKTSKELSEGQLLEIANGDEN